MLLRRLAATVALTLATAGAGAVVLLTIASSRAAAPPDLPEPAPAAPAPPALPEPDRVRAAVEGPAQRLLAGRRRLEDAIAWRASRALGTPNAGRLADGVLLPREGVRFFTWDPVRWTSPNDESRRWGTDRLVRTILDVLEGYAEANPDAPRVGIGDLSRPGGGSFDARYGIVGEFGPGSGTQGHVSHQNGLDADVYYPRRDGAERAPDALGDVDLELAQDLVDRFVAAGALFVFVGPGTALTGPPAVVQPLARHDDHLHVRLPPHTG
jgi:hypothetical protein